MHFYGNVVIKVVLHSNEVKIMLNNVGQHVILRVRANDLRISLIKKLEMEMSC